MSSLGRIDFMRPPGSTVPGAVMLGAGVVALAAAFGWREMQLARHAESMALVRSSELARELALRRQAVESLPRLSLQRQHNKNVHAMQVRPWLQALTAIELAADTADKPVYLLALMFDGAAGRLQVEGEGISLEEVNAFVQRLSANPVLAGTQLSAHESFTDPVAGGLAYRWQVVTHWSAR